MAMFAGGGVEFSDSLLKSSPRGSPYLLEAQSEVGEPNLHGLSCRWEPLIPRSGCMMTIMVQGTKSYPADESGLLSDVVQKISVLLGHRLQESAPASVHSMKFRWPPRGLGLEARATAGGQTFLRRYFTVLVLSLIQFWCERFNRQAGSYNAPVYRDELRSNTDFRKYDGILRMVLDVSASQAELIEQHLEREHDAGRLAYGVHVADTALNDLPGFQPRTKRACAFCRRFGRWFREGGPGLQVQAWRSLIRLDTGGPLGQSSLSPHGARFMAMGVRIDGK